MYGQLNTALARLHDRFRGVMIERNLEYGPDSLHLQGVISRMEDKLGRIKNLLVTEGMTTTLPTSALQDSALDLSNYAAILHLMLEGKWVGQDPGFIEPATLAELEQAYGDWCLEVFPDAGTQDWCDHLAEEVEELRKSDCKDPLEFGDVLLLLIDAARRNGISLLDAACEKFEINRGRDWERGEDGVYRHVNTEWTAAEEYDPFADDVQHVAKYVGDTTPRPTPRPILVYLAGPVDFVEGNGATWRQDAGEALAKIGISSYNPVGAFNYVPDPRVSEALVNINMNAVSYCTHLLVNWTGEPTLLTGAEVMQAKHRQTPVIVVSHGRNLEKSAGFSGCIIVETMHQAYSELSK
jgi:hypothetical protein